MSLLPDTKKKLSKILMTASQLVDGAENDQVQSWIMIERHVKKALALTSAIVVAVIETDKIKELANKQIDKIEKDDIK